MTKQLLKDALGWGFLLWLIGYGLGILLFTVVPPSAIGWILTPIGTVIALWVLLKKVKGDSFSYFVMVAIAWVLIAIVFDYFFLVKAFNPEDGYYKLDVYLYYALTFLLPLIVGWWKRRSDKASSGLANAKHYICTGGCRGVSQTPGTCQTTGCPNYGHSLEACGCTDNAHYGRQGR